MSIGADSRHHGRDRSSEARCNKSDHPGTREDSGAHLHSGARSARLGSTNIRHNSTPGGLRNMRDDTLRCIRLVDSTPAPGRALRPEDMTLLGQHTERSLERLLEFGSFYFSFRRNCC